MAASTSLPNSVSQRVPPLSIAAIIPTYNYAHGIKAAIASVLNQTLPPVEIIVVDDGSTDGTRNVLDTYGSRITCLYQQNRGASAARNAGVLATNCEWVAFLDHDDEWYPDKLACQAASVVESGAEFCYTGYERFANGQFEETIDPPGPSQLFPEIRFQNVLGPSSMYLVRRSTFVSLGGFDERLGASCEDWELAVRLARASRSVKVSQTLMRYNYHSSNASFKYRNLLQKELLIENTLLAGTAGLNRMITRRKVRAAIYARAAWGARTNGDRAASYALQSIFRWPLPSFMPKRFKTLLVELSGRSSRVS
jgi:glycosyltransferase involved in cell wall biosynthesis